MAFGKHYITLRVSSSEVAERDQLRQWFIVHTIAEHQEIAPGSKSHESRQFHRVQAILTEIDHIQREDFGDTRGSLCDHLAPNIN